ncbi:RNA polymerase sigma factor [Aureivirga sp. CE67]|uniref:RNA polymerase sigma factor n=1 Tax=Aureivirga sp. CE67 TaxID=1788983 RepID=UPI00293D2A6C|nr:RNA polymerase sigma factor [Aureivirga sp. CE67]
MNPENINKAIEEAKEGRQAAFNLLLNTYWKDVYHFQFSKTRNEDEAEDITIKTFSRAFDKIELYNSKFAFKNWLLSISHNILIDHTRKKKTETVSINNSHEKNEIYRISDGSPSPEDRLIIEQNLAELLSYVKKLKPHYQEMIQLRYFQEMSYKEISETINEPLNNVKVKLLRAKKLLTEIIKKEK